VQILHLYNAHRQIIIEHSLNFFDSQNV